MTTKRANNISLFHLSNHSTSGIIYDLSLPEKAIWDQWPCPLSFLYDYCPNGTTVTIPISHYQIRIFSSIMHWVVLNFVVIQMGVGQCLHRKNTFCLGELVGLFEKVFRPQGTKGWLSTFLTLKRNPCWYAYGILKFMPCFLFSSSYGHANKYYLCNWLKSYISRWMYPLIVKPSCQKIQPIFGRLSSAYSSWIYNFG